MSMNSLITGPSGCADGIDVLAAIGCLSIIALITEKAATFK